MDFWRSGRARSHRERGGPVAKGPRGFRQRLRNMYFPPWVPVAGIIFVVFGILGALFITRSATGAPRIGEDHWHATYTFYACGDKQPNAPFWESGIHTHTDGVIHIHPFRSSEEGAGARLEKWFEYGAGSLSGDEIRLPGLSKTWKNGEICPEGTADAGAEGTLQVFVNSRKLDDWSRYIPKDGDRVQLIFGPEEEVVQLPDRIVFDESNATREIDLVVSGNESTTRIEPGTIQVEAGETVKINLRNASTDVSHGLRFAGGDNEFNTGDDFVAVPVGSDPVTADEGDVIPPEGEGFVTIRFDNPGVFEFTDPTANAPVSGESEPEPFFIGTVVVGGAEEATPVPEEDFEEEVTVTLVDDAFDPGEIVAPEGTRFKLTITNEDPFAHQIRIDGPDGEFDTIDDILTDDVLGNSTGSIIIAADALPAGSYQLRDEYHKTTMTGTLAIE